MQTLSHEPTFDVTVTVVHLGPGFLKKHSPELVVSGFSTDWFPLPLGWVVGGNQVIDDYLLPDAHITDLYSIGTTLGSSFGDEDIFNSLRPLSHSRKSGKKIAIPQHPLHNLIRIHSIIQKHIILLTVEQLRWSFPLGTETSQIL